MDFKNNMFFLEKFTNSRFFLRAKNVLPFLIGFFFFSITAISQEDKTKEKELRQSKNYLSEASLLLQKEQFPAAEADYRKAISLNPENETGKYNLGNAYYKKEKNAEAQLRFKQAATVATKKAEKHKAFHNLGNTFMNEKNYAAAVDAYKNALRNNPTDDETRYNLALAKDMLEKNPPQDDGGGGKDKKENEEKEKEKEQEKENNEGEPEDKEDENKGENEKPQQPKDGDEEEQPQQQQPVPGQLSPQQIQSLLEAMNNEEEKVQEKVNAQKQKGAKVNSNKDW